MIQELVIINREELVENVKIKDNLGYSEHKMAKFKILRAVRRAHSELKTPVFKRADFGLFKGLLVAVP